MTTPLEPLVEQLNALESEQALSPLTMQHLGEVSLLLFVAPSCVGKSTLMNSLSAQDARFSRISGFTTRPPRPDDEPEMYRYLTHDETGLRSILDLENNGTLVQLAHHPVTGHYYGTQQSDYKTEFCSKDVFSGAVEVFRDLPARQSYTFGLVCDPTIWKERLIARYKTPDNPEIQKRLKEAIGSLNWIVNDPQTILIENGNEPITTPTQKIIEHVTKKPGIDIPSQSRLRTMAESMITFAENWLSEAQK